MATTSAAPKPTTTVETAHTNNLLVVDIGKKQSKKRIKQLREGRGPLLDKINVAVADMQANGAVKKDAQLLVVVVRRKEKRKILGF